MSDEVIHNRSVRSLMFAAGAGVMAGQGMDHAVSALGWTTEPSIPAGAVLLAIAALLGKIAIEQYPDAETVAIQYAEARDLGRLPGGDSDDE